MVSFKTFLLFGLLTLTRVLTAQTDDIDAMPVRKGAAVAKPTPAKAKTTTKAKSADTKEKSSTARMKVAVPDAKSVAKKVESETEKPKAKSTNSTAKTESKSKPPSKSSSSTKTAKSEKTPAPKKTADTKPATPKADDETGDVLLDSMAKTRPSSTKSTAKKTAPEEVKKTESDSLKKPADLPVEEKEESSEKPAVALPPVQNIPPPPPPPSAPPKKKTLLGALFGASKESAKIMLPPTVFNSDYATRSASNPLPEILQGSGIGGTDLPIGSEDTWRLNTLPTDFRPTDLVRIPKELCYYGSALYLRREAAASYIEMVNAARAEGLTLQLVSGYRDYNHQMRLYNQAVARGGKSQKTVARPGKSEHQLGTTADLTNSKTHLLKRSFGETPEGRWLSANAARFGWKMTVLRGTGPRSHADEPWHLRYLGGSVNKSNYLYTGNQQQPQPQQSGSVLKGIGRLFGIGRKN